MAKAKADKPDSPDEPKNPTRFRDAHSKLVTVLAQFDSLFTLKETLEQAAEAETFLDGAGAHLDDLNQQVAAAQAEEHTWRQKIAEAKADHQKSVDDLAARLAAKRQDFLDQADAAYQDKERRLAQFVADFDTKRAEYERARAALEADVMRTQAEHLATSEALTEMKAELAGLRERLHSAIGGAS